MVTFMTKVEIRETKAAGKSWNKKFWWKWGVERWENNNNNGTDQINTIERCSLVISTDCVLRQIWATECSSKNRASGEKLICGEIVLQVLTIHEWRARSWSLHGYNFVTKKDINMESVALYPAYKIISGIIANWKSICFILSPVFRKTQIQMHRLESLILWEWDWVWKLLIFDHPWSKEEISIFTQI